MTEKQSMPLCSVECVVDYICQPQPSMCKKQTLRPMTDKKYRKMYLECVCERHSTKHEYMGERKNKTEI
jgi:hypothetical protein